MKPAFADSIKVVTFDLDDTLWDNKPVIKRAVIESIAYLSEQLSLPKFSNEELDSARTHVIQRIPELAFDLTQLRSAYYTQALINRGIDTATAEKTGEDATELFMDLRSQVVPFDEADKVLAQLAKHYKLGAITNGNCRFQNVSISKHFDFYVSPLEAMSAKPDPAIYLFSAKTYDYHPHEALHVGDCINNDVAGAKKAGYQTVWFDLNKYSQHPAEADWTIHQLEELLALV